MIKISDSKRKFLKLLVGTTGLSLSSLLLLKQVNAIRLNASTSEIDDLNILKVTEAQIFGDILFNEIETPTTPPENFNKLYFKSDHKLYQLYDEVEELVGTPPQIQEVSGTANISYISEQDVCSITPIRTPFTYMCISKTTGVSTTKATHKIVNGSNSVLTDGSLNGLDFTTNAVYPVFSKDSQTYQNSQNAYSIVLVFIGKDTCSTIKLRGASDNSAITFYGEMIVIS